MIILRAKVGDDIYDHEPTPSVSMSRDVIHDEDSSGMERIEHQWTLSGRLLLKNDETIEEQVETLYNIYSQGELTYLRLLDYDTEEIIEEFPTDGKVKVTAVNFPEGGGVEWATRRTYSIEIEGEETPTNLESTGVVDYSISYAIAQSGRVTRSISGSVRDVKDGDAYNKYLSYKSTKGWDTLAGSIKTGETHEENDDTTICRFTLNHESYFKAFPSGITNADVKTESVTDGNNLQKTRVSGFFEGSEADCSTAIDGVVPLGPQLSVSITRDDYNNRTNFNVEVLESSGTIYSKESLSVTRQVAGKVFKRVLGGGNPVIQTVANTTAKARQNGTIKEKNSYPTAPAYNWSSSNLVSERIDRLPPEYDTAAGSYVYGINYDYRFEFVSNPGWT